MTLEQIRHQIREKLESQFLADFENTLTGESDLFEEGVIDSFGLVDLVAFLESSFALHFTDEELMSPEMTTLDGMANLIIRKQGAR